MTLNKKIRGRYRVGAVVVVLPESYYARALTRSCVTRVQDPVCVIWGLFNKLASGLASTLARTQVGPSRRMAALGDQSYVDKTGLTQIRVGWRRCSGH